tara:strand:- start:347 stop:517 length:171 start_codon:yes stop_codon:yes gene_type:complete
MIFPTLLSIFLSVPAPEADIIIDADCIKRADQVTGKKRTTCWWLQEYDMCISDKQL